MALTLPMEELARLQITFRLSLPDDILTFEMLSNSNSASIPSASLSGYKLHLKGSRDGSGLCLKVWAHHEEDYQPDQPTHGTNTENENLQLLSPQFTEDSSITEHSLDMERDFEAGPGQNVDFYGRCTESSWCEYQEPGGQMQLSDAFTPIEPMDGFDNNTWIKTNSAFGFLENVHENGHPMLRIDTCFDKQNVSNYHESQSIPYPSTLPSVGSFCEQGASPSPIQIAPESTILLTPITTPSSLESCATLSSNATSPAGASPTSSPDDSTRPYRCLEPTCDRWFKRDYTRKVHMLTHRRKERKPFSCSFPGCAERFSRKHDRLRHEVGRHGLESEWTCQPCHRFFSSRATMERHIFDKHGDVVSKALDP